MRLESTLEKCQLRENKLPACRLSVVSVNSLSYALMHSVLMTPTQSHFGHMACVCFMMSAAHFSPSCAKLRKTKTFTSRDWFRSCGTKCLKFFHDAHSSKCFKSFNIASSSSGSSQTPTQLQTSLSGQFRSWPQFDTSNHKFPRSLTSHAA